MAQHTQTTHSETGHPQAAPHEAFPPFDAKNFPSQILWFVIAFGLLYYLMSKVALPRMAAIIQSRADRIDQDLKAAHKMREEAIAAAAAYEKTLAEAKARSQALAAETRAKVKLEQDAKRQALETELNGKLQTAEVSIAEMKAAAMANVGQIANETAAAIVQHITGQPADPTAIATAIAEAKV
jgi:F-type H+-transporting ATPase subunit b